MDDGRWTVDGGRWTVDGRRWTVDGGRWTVDGGRIRPGSFLSILRRPPSTVHRLPSTIFFLLLPR
ncbi:MAG: hypothetical protein DYG98_01750 [Haliscomenobacteraceae bacterium CHB4]|nr:hypothetical protein [Haliscomenobacteraceae bacterium CHB4]